MSRPLNDPIHFIGIGGSGMSGLAELALKRGLQVQGSDAKNSPLVDRLVQLGAQIHLGHAISALQGAQTVVYSSAIATSNAELSAARSQGLQVLHRSEFLAYLMHSHKPLTIAGTHGKSTTTAMLTHMLDRLGLEPSASVGGVMRRYASSVRHGKGEYFVAEADESDGSFLSYRPYIGTITNIAIDHMEYFKDQTGLERGFTAYLNQIDPDGCAVIGWDSPLARQVGSTYTGHRLTFGFVLGSEVRGLNYECKNGETLFDAVVERDKVRCRLPNFGRHNALNALCVLAVARALELNVQQASEALSDFSGVDRRMTNILSSDKLQIFDDYAHNPGKIAACVESLHEAFPHHELHVVYQPHRYSRLETMYDEMLEAVESASIVHVLPVYSAGETTEMDFSPNRLAQDMNQRLGLRALPCDDFAQAISSIKKTLKLPAVILTVGAGDVWQVSHKLRDELYDQVVAPSVRP